jgi:hypothetical protein
MLQRKLLFCIEVRPMRIPKVRLCKELLQTRKYVRIAFYVFNRRSGYPNVAPLNLIGRDSFVQRAKYYVPLLDWLPNYRRELLVSPWRLNWRSTLIRLLTWISSHGLTAWQSMATFLVKQLPGRFGCRYLSRVRPHTPINVIRHISRASGCEHRLVCVRHSGDCLRIIWDMQTTEHWPGSCSLPARWPEYIVVGFRGPTWGSQVECPSSIDHNHIPGQPLCRRSQHSTLWLTIS